MSKGSLKVFFWYGEQDLRGWTNRYTNRFVSHLFPYVQLTDQFIGEQLESVHASRLRAQAAHDLIDYYIQFSRNDPSKLDVLRKESGKEGRMKLAILLRRMNTAAKEVDIPIAEQVSSFYWWTTILIRHRQKRI